MQKSPSAKSLNVPKMAVYPATGESKILSFPKAGWETGIDLLG
jgi:hypothetical protein